MADDRKIDSISTLPDEILQHILCFIPTKLAIRTSILSRRWRHVWCDTPSLSLNANTLVTAASINKTLTRYTAPKLMNFQLKTIMKQNIPHIHRWIFKFAMSHNVENMSLDLCGPNDHLYKLPDFIYINSSVKQLNIRLNCFYTMVPECIVSWTSLKKLSLGCCRLFDESMSKILSGCPILENLTLYHCAELKVLDLSKSLRLRTLKVEPKVRGPILQIVAPHIHCLTLLNPQFAGSGTTLVDVASLTEAKLDICYDSVYPDFEADFLQDVVLKMLEKLKNAEKLTFGGNFIQILSLAEIRGVPFPMFKVKALTLETVIFRYVIPGIERLLQNSPDLQKLTVRAWDCNSIPEKYLYKYLKLQGFNPCTCWRSRNGVSWNKRRSALKSKHVISLLELMLRNTNKLDKMVVMLDERYLKFKIKDLVRTLSQLQQRHHCGIVLSTTKLMTSEDGES